MKIKNIINEKNYKIDNKKVSMKKFYNSLADNDATRKNMFDLADDKTVNVKDKTYEINEKVTPKKNETKKEFIKRFMGNDEMNSEFPDTKQRFAVCMSYWNKHNKKENLQEDFTVYKSDNLIEYNEDDIPEVIKWLHSNGYLLSWNRRKLEQELYGLDNESLDSSVPYNFLMLQYDFEDDVDESNYDPYLGQDFFDYDSID